MSSFFALVRYLRLKAFVSLIRFFVKLLDPTPEAKPDAVVWIPSRDKSYTIKAHLYKPAPDGVGAARKGPLPVLLNFHGSGFVFPKHGADDGFCRRVATVANYAVLDVQYRLAPEHPFPAAVNDVQDVVQYVLDRPEEYVASEVSISGFSAGGTLALVAPTLFPQDTLQSVIAFYPATDLAVDPSLRKILSPDTKPRLAFVTNIFRESYIGAADPRDPRVSPAYADVSKYPSEILIITGELDTSAAEAEELAERVKTEGLGSGRNVIMRRMRGCGHAFDKKTHKPFALQAREETYGLVIDMLKRVAGRKS